MPTFFYPIHALIPALFIFWRVPAHEQLCLALKKKHKTKQHNNKKNPNTFKTRKRNWQQDKLSTIQKHTGTDQRRWSGRSGRSKSYPQKTIPPSSSKGMFLCRKGSLKLCTSVLEAQERLLCFGPCCEDDRGFSSNFFMIHKMSWDRHLKLGFPHPRGVTRKAMPSLIYACCSLDPMNLVFFPTLQESFKGDGSFLLSLNHRIFWVERDP